jgi:hypothetical protein
MDWFVLHACDFFSEWLVQLPAFLFFLNLDGLYDDLQYF